MKRSVTKRLLLFTCLLQFSSCLLADSRPRPLTEVKKAGTVLFPFRSTALELPPVIPNYCQEVEDRYYGEDPLGPQFLLVLQ